MDIDIMAMGLRLRKQRENMKLSRGKLAEIIEISEYYVGQLERGQRKMSLAVACAITECLHITLDYLIWGENADDRLLLENSGDYGLVDRRYEINELLNMCSDHELLFIQDLLRLILPRFGR